MWESKKQKNYFFFTFDLHRLNSHNFRPIYNYYNIIIAFKSVNNMVFQTASQPPHDFRISYYFVTLITKTQINY